MASMLEKVQPLLEQGEQVQSVLTGQTGLNPLFRFVTSWLAIANKPRIVAITDRRIAVFKAGQLRFSRTTPKALIYSISRDTRLEHGSGPWSKVVLGDEKIWMPRPAYAFLDEANSGAPGASHRMP
jgi:hypothetical protein